MQSLWLPPIRAQLALNKQNPANALNDLQAALHRVGANRVRDEHFLSVSSVRARRSILAADKVALPPPSFRNSRSQRHRVELLDGSVGASRSSSGKRVAVESRRERLPMPPRPGAGRLQRLPHPLERCRPDIPILKEAKPSTQSCNNLRPYRIRQRTHREVARRNSSNQRSEQQYVQGGKKIPGAPDHERRLQSLQEILDELVR